MASARQLSDGDGDLNGNSSESDATIDNNGKPAVNYNQGAPT